MQRPIDLNELRWKEVGYSLPNLLQKQAMYAQQAQRAPSVWQRIREKVAA